MALPISGGLCWQPFQEVYRLAREDREDAGRFGGVGERPNGELYRRPWMDAAAIRDFGPIVRRCFQFVLSTIESRGVSGMERVICRQRPN